MPPAEVAIITSRVRVEERLLAEAFSRHGVESSFVDDRKLAVDVGQHLPWAVALNRSISATRRRYVGHLLAAGGVLVANPPSVVETCDDKVLTTLALIAYGVPVPRAIVSFDTDGTLKGIDRLGYPVVVKPVTGSWGRLVSRINDADAARAVTALKNVLGSPLQKIVYTQEFVETGGRDLRVVVVNDEVIGAMCRQSDEWVTNAALGASTKPHQVDDDLEALARAAARAVGGGAVGVDILESSDGDRFVNEVNGALEFRAITETCGVDVAGAIVRWVLSSERHA